VNTETGYGGLTWFVTQDRAVAAGDEIADHVWVTDNPSPPGFDPRVVSELHYPVFYHPNSTIPAAQVQAALEEFCRTSTGDRPECVRWVHGTVSGERLDAEPNRGIKRRSTR
jgi:Immunity protein Imm1